MEIKNVVKKVNYNYPKINQINKKDLRNMIPDKWTKIGLSSLGISLIMKNNVWATVAPKYYTGGGSAVPISITTKICNIACPTVQILSVLTFLITGLNILITTLNSKKTNKAKEVKKWIKILFIVSIILFIMSTLIKFLV